MLQWLQSQESEKDKLRSSLGNAIMVERPNVKVCAGGINCPPHHYLLHSCQLNAMTVKMHNL